MESQLIAQSSPENDAFVQSIQRSPIVVFDAVLAELEALDDLAPESFDTMAGNIRRFARYCQSGGSIQDVVEIDPDVAEAFVYAETKSGSQPSLNTKHARRSAISFLYARGRSMGLLEERIAKGGLLEVRDIEVSPGVIRPIAIHVKDGQPGFYKVNVEGDEVFDAFVSLDVESRRNRSGLYRMYKNYRLPEELGGGTERIRLYGTDKDKGGPARRPEILRSIPPGTRDFERLYGRRADIESINRAIEDRLYWNRSHSVGYRGGLFDLLCFARMTNAITKGKYRALVAEERSA